jgi:threonine dehydrogenase-like Zn-dependent dehydrogenase
MKALRFDGELRMIRDASVPRREGEALVQVISAGICNTDLEIVKGYAGFHGTLGHEFVGRVVESADSSMVGRRVVGEINAGCGRCDRCVGGDTRHCPTRTVLGIKGRDGAFAEFLSLPVSNLIEIPDELSNESAVFIEPLAAALQILDQVSIGPGSDVAVIGDGKLAQLVVRAIAHTGCRTLVLGKHTPKLDLAARSGARVLLVENRQPATGEMVEEAEDSMHSRQVGQFDVVIEASGSASGLPLALSIVKPRGTVVLKSTHSRPTELQISAVVVNEISIVGSRCGRFGPAIDLLKSGGADVSDLVTARFPLDDGVAAFARAAEPSSLKIILNVA